MIQVTVLEKKLGRPTSRKKTSVKPSGRWYNGTMTRRQSIVDRVQDVARRMGLELHVPPVRGLPFGRGARVGVGGTVLYRRVRDRRESWEVGCVTGLTLPEALSEVFK